MALQIMLVIFSDAIEMVYHIDNTALFRLRNFP